MKLRFERKYLVPNHHLPSLRKSLSPFVLPDKHTLLTPSDYPEYTVRSIYFDSPDLDALYDKSEGVEIRKKLRIRAYNTPEQNKGLFFEIKRKIGNKIGKNRAFIPQLNFESILQEGWDDRTQSPLNDKTKADLHTFLFYYHKKNQQPVNLIVYDREAYHGKFNSEVRITFDKNIRSKLNPSNQDLFTNLDLDPVWPHHFILEIKYFHAPMPSWAKNIVDSFSLQTAALSKYAEGVYCHSRIPQTLLFL